jgi:hypothetical protein
MPVIYAQNPYRVADWSWQWEQNNDPETTPQQVNFQITDATPDSVQIVTAIYNFSIQYASNSYVRGIAEMLLPAGIQPNDTLGQYNAVATFILTHMVYVADPVGVEYMKSPVQHLKEICATGSTVGDCDDHVLLFNTLLNALGFTTYVVGVQADPTQPGVFTHVISGVKLNGSFYYFDACNKSNPYEIPAGQLLVIPGTSQ